MFISLTMFGLGQFLQENNVLTLLDSNFDSFLSTESDKLVLIYNHLCQISLELIEEYNEVGKSLQLSGSDIKVAKINIFQNPMVKSRYNISHFPVLSFITEGFFIEYHGPRVHQNIVEWASQLTKPNYFLSKCLCEQESRMKVNNLTAVLFAKEDSNESKIFKTVSKASWTQDLIISISKVAWRKYKINQPALVVFKNFENKQIVYEGPFEAKKVAEFLYLTSIPNVLEFNEQTIEIIFRDLNPVIFIFSSNSKDYSELIDTLSKEYEGLIFFCKENLYTADHGRLSEYLKVSKVSQPTAVILDPKKNFQVFQLSEKITLDSLRQFLNDWENEKLEGKPLKSEEIPENSHENNVKVFVAKTLFDVAYDTSKDVLVYYYTPSCVPCKKLTPEYEKLATHLQKDENIVVAKINAEENDLLNELVDGFPTILLYPANNKKSIEFYGNRDFDGLLNFLADKISTKTFLEKVN